MFFVTLHHAASSLHASLLTARVLLSPSLESTKQCELCVLPCLNGQLAPPQPNPARKGFWLDLFYLISELPDKWHLCALWIFSFWFCLDYKALCLPFGYPPISRISPGWSKHHFLLGIVYSWLCLAVLSALTGCINLALDSPLAAAGCKSCAFICRFRYQWKRNFLFWSLFKGYKTSAYTEEEWKHFLCGFLWGQATKMQ